MNASISLDVELRAFVRPDADERWIAVCPSIDVASQGTDTDDAKRCLDEAVQLWFESCIERGTLERALQERRSQPLLDDQLARLRGNEFFVHVTMSAQQATA